MFLRSGRLLLVGSFPDINYSKDMGVTHADFFRLLPSAMGDHPYRIEGNTVHGDVAGGSVVIAIGEQQVRRIALLEIPFANVTFSFRGVSPEQQEAFSSHFDLRYQRGGG